MKMRYELRGTVFGNCWGGGIVGYPSETLHGDNKSELLDDANKMFRTGSLDSGMGFESLVGARLNLYKYKTLEIEGKSFTNVEIEDIVLGEIPDGFEI